MTSHEAKWFLASKTMIVAMLTTLAGVLGLLIGEEWIQEYPQVVAVGTIVLGIITGIIRVLTTSPVTFTKPPTSGGSHLP